jgi:AraC-like DNA-binding protein
MLPTRPAPSVGRRTKGSKAVLPDALGVATRHAARHVREAGIALAPLLKITGLSVEQIDNKDNRIAVVSQVKFLELAAKALQDPSLGFRLACECDLREMGLLHYAAGAATTLLEAIRRFERYSSIANEGVIVRCLDAGKLMIELSYKGISRHSDQQQMEFLATTVIRGCRVLTGAALKPLGVQLVHQAARSRADLDGYFGCQVTFGAEIDRISFDKEVGQLSLVGADPFLDKILLEYCEQALAARHTNSSPLRISIENAVTPLLPHGEAKFDKVARGLGVSRRTLGRRLKSEGLSFSEILRQLRSDLITRYLGESDFSISQVAWLVGFQSLAAFSHSCKRWYGMSPKELRRALLSR